MMKDLIKEFEISFLCLLETHVAGDRAVFLVQCMGLGVHFIENVCGHSGGIWCSWDPTNWMVTVLRSTSQCVRMCVKWRSQPAWLLTVVYGSPQQVRRRQLWQELKEIGQNVQEAWGIVGDFNAVLHQHERRGADTASHPRGSQAFMSFIHDCGVLNAGFQRHPFTWGRGTSEARLDRLLVNMEWRTTFSEVVVHHLHHYESDHRPLLIKFSSPSRPNHRRHPFRFKVAWLTHDQFEPFLRSAWDLNKEWVPRMHTFQEAVKDWNRSTFGNIFAKKKELLRRLNGIPLALARGPNAILFL